VTIPGFSQTVSIHRHIRALQPEPPAWVSRLLAHGTCELHEGQNGRPLVEVVRRDPFVRLTTRVPNAVALSAFELSRRVSEGYAALDTLLSTLKRRAVRIWNYVPGIVETMEPGLDRYMAFNRGRYSAVAESWGIETCFEHCVPTASAVGITGPDLVIDCLSSAAGGHAVDNPRQTNSWRYSRRYGPMPPCFARGTISMFDGRRMLLIGGTASIVGEESRHSGNIRAQADEALTNIEAVITGAGGPTRNPLERLTDARIYVVNEADAELVEGLLRARSTEALRTETVLARVCRPELLVEIEGLADLPADNH
jgi:enamine deaminase RidA (YjgF/YER057c/UK114 family)